MNTQRKLHDTATTSGSSTDVNLFDGDGTAMFSSGSAPGPSTAATTGDGTHLFSSGSAPGSDSAALTGNRTEMFSSGS